MGSGGQGKRVEWPGTFVVNIFSESTSDQFIPLIITIRKCNLCTKEDSTDESLMILRWNTSLQLLWFPVCLKRPREACILSHCHTTFLLDFRILWRMYKYTNTYVFLLKFFSERVPSGPVPPLSEQSRYAIHLQNWQLAAVWKSAAEVER